MPAMQNFPGQFTVFGVRLVAGLGARLYPIKEQGDFRSHRTAAIIEKA